MILKGIICFSGLYVAFQLCLITIAHVFDFDPSSGAQVGVIMGSAYGAMAASVSEFRRAPTTSENWILALSVNTSALVISLMFLVAVLLFDGGFNAVHEFLWLVQELPIWALIFGMTVTFIIPTLLCLWVFGALARRYLKKLQPA